MTMKNHHVILQLQLGKQIRCDDVMKEWVQYNQKQEELTIV
jgi:hypothetical protein